MGGLDWVGWLWWTNERQGSATNTGLFRLHVVCGQRESDRYARLGLARRRSSSVAFRRAVTLRSAVPNASVHPTGTAATGRKKKNAETLNGILVGQQHSRIFDAGGCSWLEEWRRSEMNHINHGPVEKAQCKKQRRQHHHGNARAASTSRQRCAAEGEQNRQCGTH